jgi:hypothetical protein
MGERVVPIGGEAGAMNGQICWAVAEQEYVRKIGRRSVDEKLSALGRTCGLRWTLLLCSPCQFCRELQSYRPIRS